MRLRFCFQTSNTRSFHNHLTFCSIPYDSTLVTQVDISQTYTRTLQSCLQKYQWLKTRHVFDEKPEWLSHLSTTCKIIHAQSLKLGIWSRGPLGDAILDLYAKCGNVDFAEKVFGGLENKGILAWNSLLSMYSKLGFLDKVDKCYKLLQNHEVCPNEFTFAIILSTYARLETVQQGRQVHCNVIKMGFQSSSFCNSALIDMYAKCNSMNDCRSVFEGGVDLDTVAWTSMISGYVKASLLEEALEVFNKMKSVGVEPDQVAFVTTINAYVGLGMLDDASYLFSQMANPNVVAWNLMISGHAKRGYEEKAVEFFLKMRKANVKSTRSTLGSVLSAVASLSALDIGLAVHAEAIKLGLHSNVYVGSSLINMYSKCKKIETAKNIFDALVERNIVLWNAMIGGYAQNGCPYEVLELFNGMKISGLCPDEFTYTSILSSCAFLEHLEGGRQLHSIILKTKFSSNLFVGNALVDMYAKCNALTDAKRQFELMRNKDNISWNAIIVGYVQEENEAEAFNMFHNMHLCGILPDEFSMASILSACANVEALNQGRQIHCFSIKSCLETSLYVGSSLIDMYAKCGISSDAHKIFDSMPERSVVSMNALISGYAPTDLVAAILLFKTMQVEGLEPSEITFTVLLDSCCEPQYLNLGRQIHCLILNRGLPYHDEYLGVSLLGMYMNCLRKTDACNLFSEFLNFESTILWTAMISGLTRNDYSDEALQFYQQMRGWDIPCDQATFVSVLKACANLASIRDGRGIHSLIFRTGFHSDELSCSSLVDMYAKCGEVESASQVFNEMPYKNDVISWNSMIVGFAKNGCAEDALRVFNEMELAHVRPDEITFLGVLTACSHAGRVSEGRQMFDSMIYYYKIQPRIDHFACVVDLLGRWGFLQEAEEFIYTHNLDSHAMIWSNMLGACRIHGDDIRGGIAAARLVELEPQDSSHYVLLSNMHSASGNWSEVNNLRTEMREKGMKKLPGCSWI